MNEELVEKLLNTKNEDDFCKVLISQKVEYDMHRELWDERVIEHFIKIFNVTREEFEKKFFDNPPIDDFDDGDNADNYTTDDEVIEEADTEICEW